MNAWVILGALCTAGLLFFWIALYGIWPWIQNPRIEAAYPDLSNEATLRPDQETSLSFYIMHKGGFFGFDGKDTEKIWVYCYFPEDFSLIEGKYRERSFPEIWEQIHSGRFTGRKSVLSGGFFLTPKEHQEISVKLRTPHQTGRRDILLLITAEQKTLALRKLWLTIQA